jgi:predicted helicase
MASQIPSLFPTPEQENRVISLHAADLRKSFGAIMTNVIPNLSLSDPS